MTRSIAGRYGNGRLVAALVGALGIIAAGALAGCGSGQISETASIVSAVPGGSAAVAVPTKDNPNGALLIKNVTVDYNSVSGYAAGTSAPLSVWLVNQSTEPVTVTAGQAQLIDPTKDSQVTPLGSMALSGGTPEVVSAQSAPSSPPNAAPAPAPSEAPSAPSEAPSEPGSIGGGSKSAGAGNTASAPAGGGTAAPSITVQPGTMAVLSTSAGSGVQHLVISGLSEAVVPGNTVQLTFNVTVNGTPLESTQVVAPIAPPTAPAARVPASGFPPSPSEG